MEPQQITVPIDGCHQLMFWLSNTNGNSAKYLIYDVVVSKKKTVLDIPVPARMSLPVKREVKTSEYVLNRNYERYPSSYKSDEVDSYLSSANNFYRKVCDIIDKKVSHYYVYTYYLDSSLGVCKAIQLRSARDEDSMYDINTEYLYLTREVETLAEMRAQKVGFKIDYASAVTGLLQLGFDAVKYKNYLKTYKYVLDECLAIVDALYFEKLKELAFLEWVVRNAMTLDGVVSTDETMLCPLTTDDVLPDYPLQHVRYFNMEE
jgi:hypothetical protein